MQNARLLVSCTKPFSTEIYSNSILGIQVRKLLIHPGGMVQTWVTLFTVNSWTVVGHSLDATKQLLRQHQVNLPCKVLPLSTTQLNQATEQAADALGRE
jgi:hypothetical protein